MKKQLDEKVVTGGGATGTSQGPEAADKKATLPASHLGNGEPMKKIEDPNNPGVEETDSANNTKPTGDKAASNKASVAMKPSGTSATQSYSFVPQSVKEDVEALFSGEELSEEFKEKATTIFEAAVSLRVEQHVEALQEQFQEQLSEAAAAIEADLTEKVNAYMDYVVEQWLEENEVAIESSLRTEITENFIEKLHTLFSESYMEVPADKVDVLGEMATEVDSLKEQLDRLMNENVALKQELSENTREKILATVSEGLTATQAEKLAALSEGVNFESAESFAKKLSIVKESYFPSSKGSKTLVEEMLTEEDEKEATQKAAVGPMSNYVNALSRTLKK